MYWRMNDVGGMWENDGVSVANDWVINIFRDRTRLPNPTIMFARAAWSTSL